MAEGRRPQGGGRGGDGGRSGGGRDAAGQGRSGGRPGGQGQGRPSSGRSGAGSSGDARRGSDPRRDGKAAGSGGGRSSGPRRDGKPGEPRRASDDRRGARPERRDNYKGSAAGSDRRDGGFRPRDAAERTAEQQIYDGPPIPDDVAAKDLDKHAMRALHGLADKLVDRIARHLVMAGLLLQEDPELAYKHALAARARATRNPMIREACAETAYAAGKFREALAEFRAAKRMNGQVYYTPMMADCERALGHADKAIKMDTPDIRMKLDEAGQIELSIVVAGARRDLGQAEAAVRLLETEPLHSKSRAEWVARLRYAYADSLLDCGRKEDAIEWFHRAVAVDGDKLTDAEERLAELTQS
ncbi:MAG: tetratricopeptide repeat protein [Aeromicrobium sp.]